MERKNKIFCDDNGDRVFVESLQCENVDGKDFRNDDCGYSIKIAFFYWVI